MRNVQARRIALAAQGFCDSPPKSQVTRSHFKRAFSRMQILQLDSVQYVCRSHYLPMFSRLGAYDTERLDEFTYNSDLVLEVWGHEASLIPMEHEPLLRWRQSRASEGLQVWKGLYQLSVEEPEYIESAYQQVVERGALRPGQLVDARPRSGDWWGASSIGKLALEWLFRSGRLGAKRDSNFRRYFDLPERIIPADIAALPTPSLEQAQRDLLVIAAKAHGIGTLDCLADYHRLGTRQARPRLEELVEDGQLLQVDVEGWNEPAYMHPEAKRPRSVAACTMLSPFDPVVWNRRRAALLFDFDYRIEIYVPKPKRIYGYYVLPFLLGDELVGRIEIKTDRKQKVLRVVGAWAEPDHLNEFTAAAMASSVRELSKHLAMNDLATPSKGNLAKLLTAQLG